MDRSNLLMRSNGSEFSFRSLFDLYRPVNASKKPVFIRRRGGTREINSARFNAFYITSFIIIPS